MYLCMAVERRTVSRVTNRWWEHDGLDVEEMRTAAWEAERMEGEE